MQAVKRHFSPYELTHLARHGISLTAAEAADDRPVEYLTGWVEFAGLELHVTPDVLIPRLETEELVTLVRRSLPTKSVINIAEVGTGSGAISLALARDLVTLDQDFSIIAGDISPLALQIARTNQDRLFKPSRSTQTLEFIDSDLLASFPPGTFDVILANLPYIPSSRLPQLDPSVKNYEPVLALDGGIDGLHLIRRLIDGIEPYLTTTTQIFLEIDETHTLAQLSALHPRLKVTIHQDQFGKNRFAQFQLK